MRENISLVACQIELVGGVRQHYAEPFEHSLGRIACLELTDLENHRPSLLAIGRFGLRDLEYAVERIQSRNHCVLVPHPTGAGMLRHAVRRLNSDTISELGGRTARKI
jgi:hypothetical protein